ncbi:hypothetical protein D3C71_1115650 [compost metagenome]
MPDTTLQLTHTLTPKRLQLTLRQHLAIRQLQTNPGHGHAVQLQHIVATAERIQPLLGLRCRHGGGGRCVDSDRRSGNQRATQRRHRQANLVGNAVGHRPDHHLQTSALAWTYYGYGAECFQVRVGGFVAIHHVQAQACGAGADGDQVFRAAQGLDVSAGPLVVGDNDLLGGCDAFTARGFQVEAADTEIKHDVVDDGVRQANREHQPAVGGFAPAENHVDEAAGEGEPQMDVQRIGDGHRQTGQQGVQQKQ